MSPSSRRNWETALWSDVVAVLRGDPVPQIVDEAVGRHDFVRMQKQRDQEGALTLADDLHQPPVPLDLEWSENSEHVIAPTPRMKVVAA